MKLPMPAPDFDAVFHGLLDTDTQRTLELMTRAVDDSRYFHWDELRHRRPPEGLSHDDWWFCLKHHRRQQLRTVPLHAKEGGRFSYVLTDKILRDMEDISSRASGNVGAAAPALGVTDRNKYLVRTLEEEAITSSQLEGAATSRRVAKEMLDSGRKPVDESETMIYNNYMAMRQVRTWASEDLGPTPERILELHRILVEDTLDDPDEAGVLDSPGKERVAIYWEQGQVVHVPPPAAELPERLEALCEFANTPSTEGDYVPPLVRAIIVHFIFGYDHYFADGNGRTARAVFYWRLLLD